MNTPFTKPGKFWRGSLHVHSSFSDGRWPLDDVIRFYRDNRYDFVSITDHFLDRYNWPITDTTAFRTPDFTTLYGAELHTGRMELGSIWHLLAVGLPLDFAPPSDDETGPQLAQRAVDAGAYVAAAHPKWFAMTEQDMLALGSVHAIEIYNGSCDDDSDTADSTYMWDSMLGRGLHYTGCATDDSHFNGEGRGAALGWVMVRSETLEPEALLNALKMGDYYSSSGPEIYDIEVHPGDNVVVRCSPAQRVFALGIPPESRIVWGNGISSAEISLENWRSPFVRVLVRDDAGRKAWANPIWLDV